jgi:Homeodomain-like domain
LQRSAAVAKRYRVTLTMEERAALGGMISRGKADARKLTHARVLLQADASEGGPDWTDLRIAEAVRVSVRTIERVRQRFVEDGLEAALLPSRARGFTRASWTASRRRS